MASQAGAGVGQPTESYGYTALEQLESVNGSAVFDHDAADNLTRLRSATLAYDEANQLTSTTPDGGPATAYGHDARGNRVSRTPPGQSAVTYGWDLANRMTSAESGAATYAYDGDGLRASKTVGGVSTAFTWDASGGLPLAVRVGSTSVVYGPGGLPLQQVASDGTAHWFFHDQLGSTRALTDSSGAVAGTWSYDPYGAVIASGGTATTPFGFAGEYTDAETGFVYLRARYYDPATGQFLSRDPLVSTTRSAYGYAKGSPLNLRDPSGMTPEFTFYVEAPRPPGMSDADWRSYQAVVRGMNEQTCLELAGYLARIEEEQRVAALEASIASYAAWATYANEANEDPGILSDLWNSRDFDPVIFATVVYEGGACVAGGQAGAAAGAAGTGLSFGPEAAPAGAVAGAVVGCLAGATDAYYTSSSVQFP